MEEADFRVVYLTVDQFRGEILRGKIKDAPTLAAFALMQLRGAQ